MKSLKKNTDHNHDEFNKLTAEGFDARLAQANLVTKTGFDDKLKTFNHKIYPNKTKYLLIEKQFKKLQCSFL